MLDPVLAPSLPDGVGVIENITPLMSDAVSVPVTDRVDLCTSVVGREISAILELI